jgi:hypothetical protein
MKQRDVTVGDCGFERRAGAGQNCLLIVIVIVIASACGIEEE